MAARNDEVVKELETKIKVLDAEKRGKLELMSFLQQEMRNPHSDREKYQKLMTLQDEVADITSNIESMGWFMAELWHRYGGDLLDHGIFRRFTADLR
ncbi:hypothetical protein TSUD_02770 [Trifolium subterraneum]|uniref:Uncharacterized protein n=1 Tax=Trifolium subterraneum TaxID=3900 RepID=A0A2Z6M2Q9_TRISU|nr:hypothetical protein TSUD_02770 [Trifolium subterraneum]